MCAAAGKIIVYSDNEEFPSIVSFVLKTEIYTQTSMTSLSLILDAEAGKTYLHKFEKNISLIKACLFYLHNNGKSLSQELLYILICLKLDVWYMSDDDDGLTEIH